MTVVFATCDDQPLVAPDDEPLAEALHALGIGVTPIPWTEIDPSGVVEPWPIVLRSTWDYHRVPTMFAAWLEAIPSADVLTLASRVMSTVPADCAYARVDIVEVDRGPLLMELELIEPELYFTIVPDSAARMAREISPRLL